jgi:hypothetical protein
MQQRARQQKLHIAVLWTGLSGYLNACLRTLAAQPEVELFVAHSPVVSEAPFSESEFAWMPNRFEWTGTENLPELSRQLEAFSPTSFWSPGGTFHFIAPS